ncbi:MAG: hypothetical protein AAB554_03075 [Patescibacteria group bacterium]
MRPTRILQWTHPDEWKDEAVEPGWYEVMEDDSIRNLRLVGIELDYPWKDLTGPKLVRGVYANATTGRRVYFPKEDGIRPFNPPKREGCILLHEHPLTPIEELQTHWVSVYGHCPGEGYGRDFIPIDSCAVRVDDVRYVIGRFETARARTILDRLPPSAPVGTHAFLGWLNEARSRRSESARAEWFACEAPAVLWCCSPAEADALKYGIRQMLEEELIGAFAKDKGAEGKYDIEDPRTVMAEHLDCVTKPGDPGRYLAAAAFRRLNPASYRFQLSLMHSGKGLIAPEKITPESLKKRLGLTDDDLLRLAEAERMLGL